MNGKLIGEVRDAYHRIFGIPDYEAYLRHMAERHPGDSVSTRDEFARQFIDRRYGRMKARCC
jgi:uncharacterized short protein YbdD (DUF466 family)